MGLAGYSGTPLVRKLGIKAGMTVGVFGAPAGFRTELVGLPADVTLRTRVTGTCDLVLWFVRGRRELEHEIGRIEPVMADGLWIAWPKKASGVATDVTGDVVRAVGLASGLVDYKVCAINQVWSGLKFARRKKTPGIFLRKS